MCVLEFGHCYCKLNVSEMYICHNGNALTILSDILFFNFPWELTMVQLISFYSTWCEVRTCDANLVVEVIQLSLASSNGK